MGVSVRALHLPRMMVKAHTSTHTHAGGYALKAEEELLVAHTILHFRHRLPAQIDQQDRFVCAFSIWMCVRDSLASVSWRIGSCEAPA